MSALQSIQGFTGSEAFIQSHFHQFREMTGDEDVQIAFLNDLGNGGRDASRPVTQPVTASFTDTTPTASPANASFFPNARLSLGSRDPSFQDIPHCTDDAIKRPPNCFIIFRGEYCGRRKTAGWKGNSCDLSIEAGKAWHALSPDEQEPYKERAKEELRKRQSSTEVRRRYQKVRVGNKASQMVPLGSKRGHKEKRRGPGKSEKVAVLASPSSSSSEFSPELEHAALPFARVLGMEGEALNYSGGPRADPRQEDFLLFPYQLSPVQTAFGPSFDPMRTSPSFISPPLPNSPSARHPSFFPMTVPESMNIFPRSPSSVAPHMGQYRYIPQSNNVIHPSQAGGDPSIEVPRVDIPSLEDPELLRLVQDLDLAQLPYSTGGTQTMAYPTRDFDLVRNTWG
ncbi:hypothetical protein CVT26_009511 [Gymnopilus dilepis]|uniref:HMG box domain-containing protein n=1 Tax=Gymnopilus dilepis TaxID=231916 RepID=A0A409VJV9_9AGAR|nr:hypothetical protein CVT26_009511 [Gymnopilus dilepis]